MVGIRVLAYTSSLMAAFYLGAGLLSLYNWVVTVAGGEAVAADFARPSLGDALVLLAVGLLAAPSPVFLKKREPLKAYASAFVAALLASAALVIEVLVQAASIVDTLLAGEEPAPFNPLNAQIVLGLPMTVLLAVTAIPFRRRELLEEILEKATA